VSGNGVTLGEWARLIGRARIGRERKLTALTLASYANNDGTNIHCGVSRLALDCEAAESTVRRHLAWLRNAGLVELVRPADRFRGWSDEYRLIIGPDVLEHMEVLDPDAYERAREAARAGSRERMRRLRQRRRAAVEPVDNCRPQPVDNCVGAESVTPIQMSVTQGGVTLTCDGCDAHPGERPPPIYTSPITTTSPKTAVDLRTDLTVDVDARPAGKPILRLIQGAVA
jgi:DNA-binding transcriptional ArsR family regulator